MGVENEHVRAERHVDRARGGDERRPSGHLQRDDLGGSPELLVARPVEMPPAARSSPRLSSGLHDRAVRRSVPAGLGASRRRPPTVRRRLFDLDGQRRPLFHDQRRSCLRGRFAVVVRCGSEDGRGALVVDRKRGGLRLLGDVLGRNQRNQGTRVGRGKDRAGTDERSTVLTAAAGERGTTVVVRRGTHSATGGHRHEADRDPGNRNTRHQRHLSRIA